MSNNFKGKNYKENTSLAGASDTGTLPKIKKYR
jgi:hypothetical protein